MQLAHTFSIIIASSAALIVGCIASDTESKFQDGQLDVPLEVLAIGDKDPPAGMNGLTPACLWGHGAQAELRALAAVKLNASGGQLPAMPGITVSCRPKILSALIQCALTPELSIQDPLTGDTYQGWWGLASEWLKDPLGASGRRWVTACMLQKLNYHGLEVPILMEGSHSRIATNPAYDLTYPFDESTTFGDMFSSTTPLKPGVAAFQVYVCTEDDLVAYCGGANYGGDWLNLRICDGVAPGGCGMTFLGKCSDPDVAVKAGGYWQFLDADGVPVTETIRVRLKDASHIICL